MAALFARMSNRVAHWSGSYLTFLGAISVVLIWAVTGPFFGFSNTWQLVINTGTTVVTFLMVFLIQNTQNRDARAVHLKLDELIRANEAADNALLNAEEDTDIELADLKHYYDRLSAEHTVLTAKLAAALASTTPGI